VSAPAAHAGPGGPPNLAILTRPFPPTVPIVMASLASVLIGGIWLASFVPRKPPLGVPTVLGALGVVLLVVGLLLLTRVPWVSKTPFPVVWRWAFLAYLVIAALIWFAFFHNHTRGATLALVTVMLAVFALDVPTLIAATVARYTDTDA